MPDGVKWNFDFNAASALLDRDPSKCPPGHLVTAFGVDGRIDSVLRRYPGHLRYADTNGALGVGTAQSIDSVRYVEFQKQKGSTDKIRGFVVFDRTSGVCELWYRFSTDTAGVLRKLALTGHSNADVASYDPSANTFGAMAGGLGTDAATHRVQCFCTHDDGNGTYLYAGGQFRWCGGRNIYGVGRWNGTNWDRLSAGIGFNGIVYAMASFNGALVVGGDFTQADGAAANALAVWNTDKWVEFGGGSNGPIYAMKTDSTNVLYVGGEFTSVNIHGTPVTVANVAKFTPT